MMKGKGYLESRLRNRIRSHKTRIFVNSRQGIGSIIHCSWIINILLSISIYLLKAEKNLSLVRITYAARQFSNYTEW